MFYRMTPASMSVLQAVQPQDAVVTLKYLKNCNIYKHIPPYILGCKVDEGFPLTNTVFEDGPLETIHDIRGLDPEAINLDDFGFYKLNHTFQAQEFDTESVNKPGGYLDELKQVAKAALERQGIPVDGMGVINWVVSVITHPALFLGKWRKGKQTESNSLC